MPFRNKHRRPILAPDRFGPPPHFLGGGCRECLSIPSYRLGANDGPEFAQTDIGPAIGTDAAVAIEASEVTLIIGFIGARHQPIGTAMQ